jgi:hypothetical protein
MVRSTLTFKEVLEITRVHKPSGSSLYPRRLRGEKSYYKSGHESGQDCDKSLIASMHIMPVLRLAMPRPFDVTEQ